MIRRTQVGNPLREGVLILFMAFVSAAVAGAADTPDLARQILEASEVKGGLVDDTVYGFELKKYTHYKPSAGTGALEYHLYADVKGMGRNKRWKVDVPLIVRSMAQADKTLFIVGPPDLVDENVAVNDLGNPEIQAKLAAQNESWYGKKLAEYKLDALPVFDTMAAANGRLYFATTDGKVRCYAAK